MNPDDYCPEPLKSIEPIANKDRLALLRVAAWHAKYVEGDWAEFGVFKGSSAIRLSQIMPQGRTLHLFDSFEGLPEEWVWSDTLVCKPGHFKCEPPPLPPNSELHIGLFKDTVAPWAASRTRPLSLIHIDSDLYQSAIDALYGVAKLVIPGTVIIFDELFGYKDYLNGEWKALHDWSRDFGVQWDYICRLKHCVAAIQVIGIAQ